MFSFLSHTWWIQSQHSLCSIPSSCYQWILYFPTIYSNMAAREPLASKADHCPPLINVLTPIIHPKWSFSLLLYLLAFSLTHYVPAVLASLFFQHTRKLSASCTFHWLLSLFITFSMCNLNFRSNPTFLMRPIMTNNLNLQPPSGRQNSVLPPNIHISFPRICEYVTSHNKGDFTGLIKLRILKWGHYTGLSGWAWSNHKGSCRREAGESEKM